MGGAGSSAARTDGMFHETLSQFGTYGNTSYGLDLDYYHNAGFRVNNTLDNLNMDVTIKQQVGPQDAAMLLIQYENYHSGDNFQYYYQTNARPFYKFDEEQQPELVGTWHHEWAPGIHTLLLLDRLVDYQTFTDRAAQQLFLFQMPAGGPPYLASSVPFDFNYQEKFQIYGAELNQICQWDRVLWLAGGRYQSGEFQTQDLFNNPAKDTGLFTPLGYGASTTSLFQRTTAYSYLTVEPLDHFWLTGGAAADAEKFPYYFRNPPINSGRTAGPNSAPRRPSSGVPFRRSPCAAFIPVPWAASALMKATAWSRRNWPAFRRPSAASYPSLSLARNQPRLSKPLAEHLTSSWAQALFWDSNSNAWRLTWIRAKAISCCMMVGFPP
jgi:hypothetical protein